MTTECANCGASRPCLRCNPTSCFACDSLREQLAAAALTGLLAHGPTREDRAERVSELALAAADALFNRLRPPPGSAPAPTSERPSPETTAGAEPGADLRARIDGVVRDLRVASDERWRTAEGISDGVHGAPERRGHAYGESRAYRDAAQWLLAALEAAR